LGWWPIQDVPCSEILILGACRPCGGGHAGVGYARSESLQLRFLWICALDAPPEQVLIVVLGLCLIEAFECGKPLEPVASHDW